MTVYLRLSPLDVLLASRVTGSEHHITTVTPAGAACDKCRRLLDVVQWSGPCAGDVGLDPVGTQPISVGPAC